MTIRSGDIAYRSFSDVAPADFLPLLNKQKNRAHLIEHAAFDADSASAWMTEKISVDTQPGCRVRAVYCNAQLAGWCGIQLQDGQYELAIVLDSDFWGLGKAVFSDMMAWAREFGHSHVYIHFLSTRPEYRFLAKMARRVFDTDMLGNRFTTYELEV